MQISFTPEFAERLRADMGVRGELNVARGGEHNPHGGGNTYELERAIDSDLILTSVGWANNYYAGHGTYTDEWGVTWQEHPYETPFGTGHYTEMVGFPLAQDEAIESYLPPDPNRPELYLDSERVIREYGDEYWIVGVTVTTIFETAWALRGYERLLMDLLMNPELADRILDIPFRYHLAAAERLAAMGVDMIWTGDDIGSQKGMLFHPDTWRRFFKPRMAELVSRVKAINPDLKVAYHTDGDVREVIPELIEIGIDVLNPVQPACMDPAELKRDYGDRAAVLGQPSTSRRRCPSGRRTTCARRSSCAWDHRRRRRSHPGSHPPRPTRYAPRELLGHDRDHPGDALLALQVAAAQVLPECQCRMPSSDHFP